MYDDEGEQEDEIKEGNAGAAGGDAEDGNGPTTNAVEKFKPEDMAEEVKIVEFLQMANRRPARTKETQTGDDRLRLGSRGKRRGNHAR